MTKTTKEILQAARDKLAMPGVWTQGSYAKTTKEILQAARDKLAVPGVWTQRALARDLSGNRVNPRKPEACQWCAYGALMVSTPLGISDGPAIDALNAACNTALGFVDFNDKLCESVEPVLAMFDRAIAACKP